MEKCEREHEYVRIEIIKINNSYKNLNNSYKNSYTSSIRIRIMMIFYF